MANEALDSQEQVKRSRDLVEKTAVELHEILVRMASALVPFPYFLGSLEVQAVEAEPGGVEKADRGCIVVCADGEMHEFTMNVQVAGGFDTGMERDDSVKPVDLPPEDYVGYAYNAIKEIAALLGEKETRAKKYSY